MKHIRYRYLFYVDKTVENGWSRAVLEHQIDSRLYERTGTGISNFEARLPELQSELAKQTVKDPYNFDFLTLREKYDERDLEGALVDHITSFLLELGTGFSYIGRQVQLEFKNCREKSNICVILVKGNGAEQGQ